MEFVGSSNFYFQGFDAGYSAGCVDVLLGIFLLMEMRLFLSHPTSGAR